MPWFRLPRVLGTVTWQAIYNSQLATLDSTNSNIMQSNCLMLLGTRFFIYGGNGAEILLDFAPGRPILACRPDATCPCHYMALHHSHKQLELASVGSTFTLYAPCMYSRTYMGTAFYSYCKHANLGYWKDAAFDDILWN